MSWFVVAMDAIGHSMRRFQGLNARSPLGNFGRQPREFGRVGSLHDLRHRQLLLCGQVHIRDRQLEFCRPHLLEHGSLYTLHDRISSFQDDSIEAHSSLYYFELSKAFFSLLAKAMK